MSFYFLGFSFLCLVLSVILLRYKAKRTISLLCLFFLASAITVFLNSFWIVCQRFTGDGVNQSVLYTLGNSLEGADFSDFVIPITLAIIGSGAVFVLLYLLLCYKLPIRKRHSLYSVLACLLVVVSVLTSPTIPQISGSTLSLKTIDGSDFNKYYVKQESIIDNPKYNLVYIYGESLERTYFDETIFPNLLPDLNDIRKNSLDYSNTQQMPATDFTIAGIVASQCGIPLFKPTAFSDTNVVSSFYPTAICLGDILKKSGYENWFYQGANLLFADKDAFFRTHGISHIWGLAESGMQDDFSIQNNWGLYDNIVLDKAWDKYKELAASGKRFALFTLTLDTHPPRGYISPGCKKNNYHMGGEKVDALSAVLCSQEDIARFVNRIQSSPWAKNTIIVVSSDHLAMPNMAVAVDYLNKHNRRDLFFILGDSIKPAIQNQGRSPLDNGATVLEVLGGARAIGLGRSSLSEKSLFETINDFQSKLYAWGDSIRALWGNPKHIDHFVVDVSKKKLSFDGFSYNLPVVFEIKPDQVLPVVDDEGKKSSLRTALAYLPEGAQFLWVDKCFLAGNIWKSSLALSTDWCVTQGRTGGNVSVEKIDSEIYKGIVTDDHQPTNTARYRRDQMQLQIAPEDIRYSSDSFKLALEGQPHFIENMMGLSYQEPWGRWSDALMAPSVLLLYRYPFPQEFDVVIKAKAFGGNVNKPIAVKIGDQTQYASFGSEPTTVKLHFTGDMYTRLMTITPPEPQLSRQGSILGSSSVSPVRKLGIGLIELEIVPVVEKTLKN
ncbi:phosphatidylglycerol--membrane-oligosaccharide glycerophosphotransferase [Superficieibacter sp. BNK-5]|uniref:phosphatidylglycerol--membrane-oligosaccharide glycerophosphotransferase n=1 Tax=Superficieibacter sp. BNK-5 TaxID=3376142 RepID=UPI0039BFF41B